MNVSEGNKEVITFIYTYIYTIEVGLRIACKYKNKIHLFYIYIFAYEINIKIILYFYLKTLGNNEKKINVRAGSPYMYLSKTLDYVQLDHGSFKNNLGKMKIE